MWMDRPVVRANRVRGLKAPVHSVRVKAACPEDGLTGPGRPHPLTGSSEQTSGSGLAAAASPLVTAPPRPRWSGERPLPESPACSVSGSGVAPSTAACAARRAILGNLPEHGFGLDRGPGAGHPSHDNRCISSRRPPKHDGDVADRPVVALALGLFVIRAACPPMLARYAGQDLAAPDGGVGIPASVRRKEELERDGACPRPAPQLHAGAVGHDAVAGVDA